MLLALMALLERRTLRMPPLEFVRIALGLSIPFLLAGHFAGTRLAYELFGRDDTYALVVRGRWAADNGWGQLTLMSVAWFHGCLGIHFVLRHRPSYRRRFHLVFAAFVLMPVIAAAGFLAMARELEHMAAPPSAAQLAGQINNAAYVLITVFAMALALVLAARGARYWQERYRGHTLTISYPGRTVRVPRGWSVLEASRAHYVRHMSACGGRARCSTCRVRVTGDPAHVPAPLDAERATLQRIGAAPDVRLACQLRPSGDVAVEPLLRAPATPRAPRQRGVEHDVVILFVDLRRWTTLAERHLPHDLSYVLDQFFEVVGQAVRDAGGTPNQFIGDSVMAIFGVGTDSATACRQALTAARNIESGMDRANVRLKQDFGHSFEFGIGIHAGRAAVGEVGWEETLTLTAVGDAVNTAARLQDLCKEYAVRLVVSEDVVHAAGADVSPFTKHTIAVRGRSDDLAIYAIGSPAMLGSLMK